MEYQSNNNRNGNNASTASNGTTNSITDNTASGSENRKPASAQQLIRENVQYLIEQMEAGKSQALTAYLDAMVHFHNYSFGNVLAIARQKPDATHVAGMWTWNQLARRVKRGERGIAILAPMIAKRRRDEAQDSSDLKKPVLLGFRKIYVWDISSTEGAPLPEMEKVTGTAGTYLDRLRTYVIAQGIGLDYDEGIRPALGMAGNNRIRILPGQTEAEEFSTLVHELSHLMLKHGERRTETTRTVRETEAEAIAFVVGKSIGLTTSTASADYIGLYHGNAALLTESLELIQQNAAIILAAIHTEGHPDPHEAAGEKSTSPDTRADAMADEKQIVRSRKPKQPTTEAA